MNRLYCIDTRRGVVRYLIVVKAREVSCSLYSINELSTLDGLERVVEWMAFNELHFGLQQIITRYCAIVLLERALAQNTWCFEDDEVREIFENARHHFGLKDLREGREHATKP